MIFIRLIIIFANCVLTDSYNLLDRYYSSNTIDIHVGPCPLGIDCATVLFEANSVLQVPGNYKHINWYFDAVDSISMSDNGINEIIFKNTNSYKGQTEFKVQNKKILEFNIVIDPYSLSYETLYNIILHELAHVYLLTHGDYKDSIMGYKLDVLYDGYVMPDSSKLQLSKDDCYGLYDKLISDVEVYDNLYKDHLIKMKAMYCSKQIDNYILEESDQKSNLIIIDSQTIDNTPPIIRQPRTLPVFNPRRRRFITRVSRLSTFRENNCCLCDDVDDLNDIYDIVDNELSKRGFGTNKYNFKRAIINT